MTIVDTQKPLTIVAKSTILDAAALLDSSQVFRFLKCSVAISTAGKASIFGVILVRLLPHSVRIREISDQKNSKYGDFSRSALYALSTILCDMPRKESNDSLRLKLCISLLIAAVTRTYSWFFLTTFCLGSILAYKFSVWDCSNLIELINL